MIVDFKINLNPSAGDLRKFGVLGYVTPEARKRIFELSAGEAKRQIAAVEKRVITLKKKAR